MKVKHIKGKILEWILKQVDKQDDYIIFEYVQDHKEGDLSDYMNDRCEPPEDYRY